MFSIQVAPPGYKVFTLIHVETSAPARGQAVGSRHAVTASCFHLSSLRMLTGSLLLCNYNATQPCFLQAAPCGTTSERRARSRTPPLTLVSRCHRVVLLRHRLVAGAGRELGTGSRPSTSTRLTVFKLQCRCFVATEYVTQRGFPRDTERS